MLLLTPASFNVVNLVSGLFYMVTLPFAAIVTTLLYFDIRVRRRARGEAGRGRGRPARGDLWARVSP